MFKGLDIDAIIVWSVLGFLYGVTITACVVSSQGKSQTKQCYFHVMCVTKLPCTYGISFYAKTF